MTLKNKWFDLTNPNLAKPTVYRRTSGYCAPEMYVDPKGLRMYESDGSLWFRNELIHNSNASYGDVIAVVPKSQALSMYQLLQDCLRDRGMLDENNELPEIEEEEGPEGQVSGFTTEWEKKGLTL